MGESGWGGVKGDEASAPDDTLYYPTQRCVRLSQCVPRARHDNTYFLTLLVLATKANSSAANSPESNFWNDPKFY